jgi:hypothetical protein
VLPAALWLARLEHRTGGTLGEAAQAIHPPVE